MLFGKCDHPKIAGVDRGRKVNGAFDADAIFMGARLELHPPTKAEVMETVAALVNRTISREQAAGWAQTWVIEDRPEKIAKDVREALVFLCSADMISTDRPFL